MLQLLIILMEISIKPKKFTLWLVVITGLLVIMHLISSYLRYYTDHGNALPIFNMDSEVSIPTWFSQSLLLATAGILFLIATFKKGSKKSYFKHWVALGIVFVYLSVDEGARFRKPSSRSFGSWGYTTALYLGCSRVGIVGDFRVRVF